MSVSRRYTSADLEQMPYDEWNRYEIIDGELHESSAPSWQHQYVVGRIVGPLDAWNDETGIGIVVSAPGVIFSPDNDVIPDLIWASRQRMQTGTDAAGHLRIAPEIVVEILSPGSANTRRDRELKLSLYDRQGVQEYWIVDWRQRSTQVYRRDAATLALAGALSGDDAIESPLLPGFSLPVARLWPPTL